MHSITLLVACVASLSTPRGPPLHAIQLRATRLDTPATAVPRRLAFRAAAAAAALAARPAGAQAVTTLLAEDIDQPPTDQRRYRLVSLSNGLRALLVSDDMAETAAAALDVHVGYASDPFDRPGVAHFSEHMLLLGNKQYPTEGAFGEYVQRRGGARTPTRPWRTRATTSTWTRPTSRGPWTASRRSSRPRRSRPRASSASWRPSRARTPKTN